MNLNKITWRIAFPLASDVVSNINFYYSNKRNKQNKLLSDVANELADEMYEKVKDWDEQMQDYMVCAALLVHANNEKLMGNQAMDLNRIRKKTDPYVAKVIRDYRLNRDTDEAVLLRSLIPTRER